MRLGIADIPRRAEGSQNSHERLWNALTQVDDSRSVEELTTDIPKRTTSGRRTVRGLRPWAEDQELFAAVNTGDFLINGFRNRDIQKILFGTEASAPAERRRRSAAIRRKRRLLRAHEVIQKVPHTHRYHLSGSGRAILIAVLTTARTSVHQLNQLATAA
jgi:hypothetical protein